jgi:hypothetical protein
MCFSAHTSGNCKHTSWQAAGPRGNQCDPLGRLAGRSSCGRICARVGSIHLARDWCAKENAVAIINTLNHQINAVLADPKVKERFADVGGAPLGGSPTDFHKLITDEIAKWGKVIRVANINPA